MILNKRELLDLLEVNKNTLKQIERRNTLYNRLYNKGLKLLRKFKINNRIMYELQLLENKNKQLINKSFNVVKTNSFIDYFSIRVKDEPHTIDALANKANVSNKTIIKWDNTLENKKILSKDGFYYFRLDKQNNEFIQVSIEEYKSFWKNKALLKAFKDLQNKYLKGEISLTQLQLSTSEATLIIAALENKYYCRVKKYKVNRNNNLYIDTMELIRGVH